MSELARMAQEAQRQYEAGETEEGGFAPEPAHNGDLQHNASVFYEDKPYICGDGSHFYHEEITISDKMRHVSLIPKEALSLLEWLQQEKPKLEQMAKEQGD